MNSKTISKARVAFAQEQKLPWLALKDTPGFGGTDIPGVDCKFFGKPDKGPWFYLIRHAADTFIPRHKHTGDVFHYILEGSWIWGRQDGRVFGQGFMQFEESGFYYGPFWSGAEGSLFLAIYDASPSFIEASDENEVLINTPSYE